MGTELRPTSTSTTTARWLHPVVLPLLLQLFPVPLAGDTRLRCMQGGAGDAEEAPHACVLPAPRQRSPAGLPPPAQWTSWTGSTGQDFLRPSVGCPSCQRILNNRRNTWKTHTAVLLTARWQVSCNPAATAPHPRARRGCC